MGPTSPIPPQPSASGHGSCSRRSPGAALGARWKTHVWSSPNRTRSIAARRVTGGVSESATTAAAVVSVNTVMALDRLPQPPAEDFKLLTAAEASELIRLPRSSVYELVRNRRIPFVRIGRRVFFVRHALIQWVSEEMTLPR